MPIDNPTQASAPDDPEGTRAAEAAQGKPQNASVVGQSSGRPTYGTGGYELNLDAEAGGQGGSSSATSTPGNDPQPAAENAK